MGIFDLFSKARKRPPTEMDAGYTAASIRVGEEHSASSASAINQVDFNRVGRAMSGSIWNASSIIATECASYPLKLYRRVGAGRRVGKAIGVHPKQQDFLKGKSVSFRVTSKQASMAESAGRIEEVISHPALSLLADPDPVTTASDFLTMLYWYREVAGKSYVWTGETTNDGPAGLYILHPQFTQPVLSRKTYIESYRYGRDVTGIIEIPAEQVIFSPYQRDPFRPWDGVSWLTSVEHYADAENAALTSEVQRWKNSGQAGFILKVPMSYTDQQMKQVEAALRSKSGPFAAGRALIIREAELVQSAAKAHEMGYVEGLAQAEKAIYRAAGIPEAIWKLNDANLAGAKIGERLLMRSCFKRMRRVAEDMTAYLLPMFGEEDGSMWFGYENPDLEDQQAEAAVMNAAFIAGVVSEDEYRKVLYLPPRQLETEESDEEMEDEMDESEDEMDESEDEMDESETETDGEDADAVTTELEQEEPTNTNQQQVGTTDIANVSDPTLAVAAADVNVSATALNGAQVQALSDLAQSVASGALPVESARAIAGAAFPTVDPAVLDAVFNPLRSFQQTSPTNETTTAKTYGGHPSHARSSSGRADRGEVAAELPNERSCGDIVDEQKPCNYDETNKAADDFVPPKAAQENAARALEWRREFGRGMTLVGVARARDISNGRSLSEDTIRRMRSYFARHEVDKQAEGFDAGEEGFPSAGRIAWDGWGGDEGRDWADRIIQKLDQSKGQDPEDVLEQAIKEQQKRIHQRQIEEMGVVEVHRWSFDNKQETTCCSCVKAKDTTDKQTEKTIAEAIKDWMQANLKKEIQAAIASGSNAISISDLSKQQLSQALTAGIKAAFDEGAKDTLSTISPTTEPLTSQAASDYVSQYNFDLVTGITRTMEGQLQTQFAQGIERGETRQEIQQRLIEEVDNMSVQRANLIAQTEASRAYQHGALKQGEEVGITGKRWRLGGNPCGLCLAAYREKGKEPTPILEPFYSAGDTVIGTDGKVYRIGMDVMVASEIHPFCHCGTTKDDTE